jgi:hypothetical protein
VVLLRIEITKFIKIGCIMINKLLKSSLIVAVLLASSAKATLITNDFNSGISADFNTYGATTYNSAGYGTNTTGHVDMSPNTRGTGSFFLNQQILADAFTVNFDFVAGGGSGADGFTFSWVTSPGIGGGGSYLGFQGLTGYGVAFDTYPTGNHIGVVHNGWNNYVTDNNSTFFEDTNWHHAQITFNNGDITVDLDNVNILTDTIANYSAFNSYMGFTAGTGGLGNYHKIDNFTIAKTEVPEPSTLAIFALGMIGLASRRFKK